jgi:hypothetical protein
MYMLFMICKNWKSEPTPRWLRSEKQLEQRVQSAVLSSGTQGGTLYLLSGVVQCLSRDPFRNRRPLHLVPAIMVALGEGALLAPHAQLFQATRSLEPRGPHSCRFASRS